MALSPKQKLGIAVVAGAAILLGFAGAASADDLPDVGPDPDPDPDPGTDPIDNIPADVVCGPGQVKVNGVCLTPPPPAPKFKCNYSGCGPNFDNSHKSPAFYAQRLQLLGYPINPAQSIISALSMTIIREFQRDSNAVKASPPAPAVSPLAFAPIAAAAKLDEDGLVGNNTIAAIERAHTATNNSGLSWGAAVELAG